KRTRTAQALADLEKQSAADAEALGKKIEQAKTEEEREALREQYQAAQTKFASRAVQIARADPRDPAARGALDFALRRTAGGYGGEVGKVREEVLTLIRKEFLPSADLSDLLYFISYQHTDSADVLLQAIAEGNPHRAVQGRAAFRLAESLAEKAE